MLCVRFYAMRLRVPSWGAYHCFLSAAHAVSRTQKHVQVAEAKNMLDKLESDSDEAFHHGADGPFTSEPLVMVRSAP